MQKDNHHHLLLFLFLSADTQTKAYCTILFIHQLNIQITGQLYSSPEKRLKEEINSSGQMDQNKSSVQQLCQMVSSNP